VTSNTFHLTDSEIVTILNITAQRLGVDFRDHRNQSFVRGIAERMHATGCSDLAAYRSHLDTYPDELLSLVASLVVPVTSFLRDAEVFEALAQHGLPALAARVAAAGVLRAWNIGVSTGEEAWSTAMLLALCCEQRDEVSFDVLATDIDEQALAVARRGCYGQKVLSSVPAALRAKFFLPEPDGESVSQVLRSRVRFVQHDLMGRRLAPPQAIVASFNLVLIRNVLIYFDRRLQDKAFERLASAVEPGGALVLGLVELPPEQMSPLFKPWPGLDPKLHILLRTEIPT